MNKRTIGIIIGLLGITIGLGGFFFIDNNIRKNSSEMGDPIILAKQDIPEGTIIKNQQEIDDLFVIRKIPKNEQVKNAIKSETNEKFNFKKLFTKSELKELKMNDSFKQNLINKKITTTLLENQQVSSNWLSNDTVKFNENDRIFNLNINLQTSVGGEVNVDDFVDVWLGGSNPRKIAGPFRVLKIKNAENVESNNKQNIIPSTIIIKCNEEQIKELKKANGSEELFLTKYGVTPTTEKNKGSE